MSRIYRVSVSDSIERVVHVGDSVVTKLQLLPVLPAERMQQILCDELRKQGLEVKDGVATRSVASGEQTTTLTVVVATGEVKLEVKQEQEVALRKTVDVVVDTDQLAERARAEQASEEDLSRIVQEDAGTTQLVQEARKVMRLQLETKVSNAEKTLEVEATRRLEEELGVVRKELDGVVHRVSVAALKERAAQIGEVVTTTEDQEAQTLEIRIRL